MLFSEVHVSVTKENTDPKHNARLENRQAEYK